MKRRRVYLFLLSILILVLFTNAIRTEALDTVKTRFETSQLSDKEKDDFLSNINFMLIEQEPVKRTITCFDVNSYGLIAMGQNTSYGKYICIYSREGVFQYGYTFHCSGDFLVEWDEGNLNIFFVRSSVIVSVTPKGEVLDVLEVPTTKVNNSYVNQIIHSTHKTIDDTEYFMGNNLGIMNLFTASYSQVIVKDSTGIEIVIYDAGTEQVSNIIVTFGVFGVLGIIAIVAILWQFVKLRHGKTI